jgi:signal transduction histidine kinase
MTGTLGLGLGVASRLTSLLGGKLSYQRFAKKSYFTVTLPVQVAQAPSIEPVPVAEMARAMSA